MLGQVVRRRCCCTPLPLPAVPLLRPTLHPSLPLSNCPTAVSPKSPSGRRSVEDVMASAYNSPKRSGFSTSQGHEPPPALTPTAPPAGAEVPAGAATALLSSPPRLAPPHRGAVREVEGAGVGAAQDGSGSGCRDGDGDDLLLLDPNTPRSPKHQLAERIMTSGNTGQVCGGDGPVWTWGGTWLFIAAPPSHLAATSLLLPPSLRPTVF